jgi:hypothetical protein
MVEPILHASSGAAESQEDNNAAAHDSQHKIKEIKIPRALLKPLQPEYRDSLDKLKVEMVAKVKSGGSQLGQNGKGQVKRIGGRVVKPVIVKEKVIGGQKEKEANEERMDVEDGTEAVTADAEEEGKTKRKKKFITNTKFLKRLKQIKKMNE